MSINVTHDHLRIAGELVAEARANGGLAPVDLDRFWEDQAAAAKDPFGRDIPQCAFGATLNWECVFAELGIPQQWKRYQQDAEWRLGLNREYNDRADKIVGRRLLAEKPPEPGRKGYPPVKELHDIFEMENRWDDVSQSYWWVQVAHNPGELEALLDRVERRVEDLRAFLLPPEWDEQREALMAEGIKPGLYRGQRGPVTFACSLYGVENLIYLVLDNPELAGRLRDTVLKAMLEKARIQDEEAGYTPGTAPHGWGFADDNCMMLNADMYEQFGYPILKGIFDRYSPDPDDRRYQHSDSAMGHLLPVLAKADLNGTNFGPPVMVDDIRRHLPKAVIHGELAPFTYSRNEEVNLVAEFLRDFERIGDSRGLVFATAGSINNGSRLTGMRLAMSAIQRHGRYDT